MWNPKSIRSTEINNDHCWVRSQNGSFQELEKKEEHYSIVCENTKSELLC